MTAEQELDNIEKIKVAVEVAANTMDFWCQVNYDDSESDDYGTKKGSSHAKGAERHRSIFKARKAGISN